MPLETVDSFLNFSEPLMMHGEEKHSYRFKSFRLDIAERQLFHDSNVVPLTPKAFDVLAALVERNGHLVKKDELLRIVWADAIVEEANVARIIHTLRRVLGEDDNGNKYIETVAKRGYRFVAKVHEADDLSAKKPNSSNGHTRAATEDPTARELEVLPSSALPSAVGPVIEPKNTTRMVFVGVGFLSAVILISLVSFNLLSASSVGPGEVKSIAILPLKPVSPGTRDSIYELGIADSLILKLSAAKGLVVRPLSATRRYADPEQDALAAGREQKVDFVLSSNYQIVDGRIRITSQLINVRSGLVEHVFKDERDSSNSFAVQDGVAASIGPSLLKRLNRETNAIAGKRYTTNDEAYRLYLSGTFLADKRNRQDALKAVGYLEQAVKLDPQYARAHSGLANAYMAVGMVGGQDMHQQYPKAKAAIEKALAIDDNLAEAHSYWGEIKYVYEWDFVGSEAQHKRALELDPTSPVAHRMHALLLGSLGRSDEAIAAIKAAIDLEPTLGLNHRIHGQLLFFARQYDEAIARLREAIEMDTETQMSYQWLQYAHRAKGDSEQAFATFIRSRIQGRADPDEIQMWNTIYDKSGWPGIFAQQLERAKEEERNGNPSTMQLAHSSMDVGLREEAFAYLEKAFIERRWALTTIKVNQRFDPLRSDPRFQDLIRRVGLR